MRANVQKTPIWVTFLTVLAVSLLLACFAFSHEAHAVQTVPYKMNFQGRITDSSGSALADGTYNMKFRIYNASSGGTLEWSEQRANSGSSGVTVTNGLFSVQLGDVTPLPVGIFTNTSLYFEIELPTPATATCTTASCESYTEGPMTPRNKLGTSAYAFNSDTLDGYDSAAFGRVATNNTWTGANLIRTANASALQVQNANSVDVFNVNTSTGTVQIGNYNSGVNAVGGKLAFGTAAGPNTVTIAAAEQTNGSYTLTIPDLTADDTICTTGTGCGGGGGGATTALDNLASTDINAALNATSNDLTLQTTTSGDVNIAPAGVVNLQSDTVLATGKTLTISGDTFTNIDNYTGMVDGAVSYDTTNNQLLTYTNGKWKADSTDAILVAASDSSQSDKNAADYVGDGNTGTANDGDQVEINQALTAAAGKKVVLLAGTYTVDASISVPNNTILAGVGNGTVITVPNSFNASIDVITNTDQVTGAGVTIRDLQLDGNGSNQSSGTQYGIVLTNIGSSSLDGATVTNTSVHDTFNSAVYVDGANNLNFTNNRVRSVASSSNAVRVGNSDNVTVANNFMEGVGRGVRLSTVTSSTVTGNVMVNVSSYGIYIDTSSNSNAVTGNTVTADTIGIYILASDYNAVTGNTLLNNGDTTGNDSILLEQADHNKIADNQITDDSATSSNDAIVLTSSDNNSISDNIMDYTGTAATNNYAISIENSASDDNYLSGNVYTMTSGTYTINDVGTGTVYAGQAEKEGGIGITIKQADSQAFSVQNAAGGSIFNIDTSSGAATFGEAGIVGAEVQLSGATSGAVTLSVASSVTSYDLVLPGTAGSAGQCLVNTSTPGTLAWGSCGATGQTATVTLAPEYTGATFTGDGSNNTGDLSSDFCSGSSRQSVNTSYCAATDNHSYYSWTTSEASAQDYDIYVRYQLPSDYETGTLSNLSIAGWGTSTSTEVVTVALYSDASGTACSTGSNAVTSNGAWDTDTTASPLGACTPVAGDMVVFKVHVAAANDGYALAGEIKFNYDRLY